MKKGKMTLGTHDTVHKTLSLPAVKLSGEAAEFGSLKVIFNDSRFEILGHDGHGLAVVNPFHGMIHSSALQDAHQALGKRQAFFDLFLLCIIVI